MLPLTNFRVRHEKSPREGGKHVTVYFSVGQRQWLIIQGRMEGNIFFPSAV